MPIRKMQGFTLIELVITVAIVAILASVAYPSYTSHMVKAKRSAAESFMYTVANRQQQSMLNARSFFTIASGTTAEWTAVNMTVPQEVSTNYTVTVTANNAGTPPTFSVIATPKGNQATKDTKCGVITLKQDGTKEKTGSASSVNDCW